MSAWRAEFRAQLRLGLPVIAVQLGLMGMMVVDVAVVGHHSVRELAGVALGNSISFFYCCFGMGALMVLDPLVSQAVGARDESAVRLALQRGLVLALVLTPPVALGIWLSDGLLELFQVDPNAIPPANAYMRAIIPGVPAFYAFVALRQTLQAMHRLRPILIAVLLANISNLLCDLWLVRGGLGVPALGAEGCGWATSINRWVCLGLLVSFGWRDLRPYLRRPERAAFSLAPLARMLVLGVPIGAHLVLEIGGFSLISLWMGRLGESVASAHLIALNLGSTSFMVPLAIGMAASVRVGKAIGAGEAGGARVAASVAGVTGMTFMGVAALLLLAFPLFFARLYTSDAEVLRIATGLILIVAAFQVFDGAQTVFAGILRGAGDTRFPVWSFLLGFWMVGMPLAWWLGFRSAIGPAGLYWGLTAGLGTAALLLGLRVRSVMRGGLVRLEIDVPPAATPPSS